MLLSMRRIYANDRPQPGLGVALCEFVLLFGIADTQTAAQARELGDRASPREELPHGGGGALADAGFR